MRDQNLVEKRMFALCLGKNGGYMQIGGYDKTGFIDEDVTWMPLTNRYSDFKV